VKYLWFAPPVLLFSIWAALMAIDGIWHLQDKRMDAVCTAALKASPPKPGELPFPHLDRVCGATGLLPDYRFMRDVCFEALTEDSACYDEMMHTYVAPGKDLIITDLPCGHRVQVFCETAFPPGLWRN